jgi:asparagine synthase (glutamine-hydrolysing)
LVYGLHDHCEDTFWSGVRTLRPGAKLVWQDFDYRVEQWYDPALAAGEEYDGRPVEVVREELLESLTENVKLRFRTDVPAGINLSGGLDSSTLLALVQRIQGPESDVKAFTFATGDSAYDELDSVREMLAQTHHPLIVCPLRHGDVPELAVSVAKAQDEPFGGIPTLAYARLCEYARAEGVIVLLDGQGMDEQWGGYEHYRFTGPGAPAFVHVTGNAPVCPDCLTPEFRSLAESFKAPAPFSDSLRNLQYRDLFFTKIPRALRFNDRVSMRASTELRVPFLDHRLVELSLRQPRERKLNGTAGKVILREVAANMLASKIVNAPKRSVQTPQREWLRTKLAGWAEECIEGALAGWGGSWLNAKAVRREWEAYRTLTYDNSFFLWQWISLALTSAPQVAYA